MDLLIVEKENGDLRLCLVPKYLIMYIKREQFVIPTVEDIYQNYQDKNIF